jgi:hypothetical protein
MPQMYAVQEVRNSKGEPILLNEREFALCQVLQEQADRQFKNSLGFELPITTLTAISKRVVEQKFFQLMPADYMPLRVGENAWSTNIVTYRDYAVGDDFEKGIINLAQDQSRLASASSAIDSLTIPVKNWAKDIHWTIPELQMAAKSGNWDVVTSKERARKKNWDLGIQKIAFLGSSSDTSILGLLNQATVTANVNTLLTTNINALSPANFATFVATVIETYRSNCNRTVMPTHFIIPEADYNGLTVPVSASFPMNSMLEYLLKAFRTATGNPNFKILPCAYGNSANNSLGVNRYVLLNYDEDSLRMDIPVDYTNTQQNSINGFQFQNVGYGQFTGVLAYRPLEMLYIDHT